jgi:hypothetical protein
MSTPLIIDDPTLAAQIQSLAAQEQRSVTEVLSAMLTQYRPPRPAPDLPSSEEMARQVRLHAYREARAYWEHNGDTARAALTDAQLDEQFWLFDGDGIPRLKSEQDQVTLPPNSLHFAGKIFASSGYSSGQTDIGMNSREILRNEYADYIIARMNRSEDHDNTDPAG